MLTHCAEGVEEVGEDGTWEDVEHHKDRVALLLVACRTAVVACPSVDDTHRPVDGTLWYIKSYVMTYTAASLPP